MARGHMLFLGSAGVVIPRAVAGTLHVRGHVPDLVRGRWKHGLFGQPGVMDRLPCVELGRSHAVAYSNEDVAIKV